MFKIRDKKLLLAFFFVALNTVIIVSSSFSIYKETQRKAINRAFVFDKALMEELSGSNILAGLNHRERKLFIFFSPVSSKEICKIIDKHPSVNLEKIYYSKTKTELICGAGLPRTEVTT